MLARFSVIDKDDIIYMTRERLLRIADSVIEPQNEAVLEKLHITDFMERIYPSLEMYLMEEMNANPDEEPINVAYEGLVYNIQAEYQTNPLFGVTLDQAVALIDVPEGPTRIRPQILGGMMLVLFSRRFVNNYGFL